MLLNAGRYICSGDGCSLEGEELIIGPAEWTWQSVDSNIDSVKRLASLDLVGVFPDHGKSLILKESSKMRKVIQDAVESARSAPFDVAERINALTIYVGEMKALGQTIQERKMQAGLDLVTAGESASEN